MIEILIVVIIIGVLVTMILPAVSRSRERARHVQCQNNLKNLHIAAMNHMYTWKKMPADRSQESWSDVFDTNWEEDPGWVGWRGWVRHFSASGASNFRAPGKPDLWWGPIGRFCITNVYEYDDFSTSRYPAQVCQALWEYGGKNLKTYLCPAFRIEDVVGLRDPQGNVFSDNNQPLRSYVMNAGANLAPLGMGNASRLLLFADAHTHYTNQAVNRAGTAKVRICRQGLRENMPAVSAAPNGSYQTVNNATYKYCTPVAYDSSLDGFPDPTATPANAWPIESVGVFHGTKKINGVDHPYGYGVFCDGHVEPLHWWQTTNACSGNW